jgi:hypothetical protein
MLRNSYRKVNDILPECYGNNNIRRMKTYFMQHGCRAYICTGVYKRPFIKNILSCFVLSTMVLSSTPKILLHSIFTHHHHVHHCTGSLKDKIHMEAEWPNCSMDAIYAVVPFILQDLPELSFVIEARVPSRTGFLPTSPENCHIIKGSRGPPVA